MANKMLIDATHPEETRVVVLRGNRVEEFDFESANRKQLRGNIYLAKVTRVEPSLQAAFVDYGGNRHGFLAFSEIHPDYYQIPVADRQALIDEEERAQRAAEDEADHRAGRRARRRGARRERSAPARRGRRASRPKRPATIAAMAADEHGGDSRPATMAPARGAEQPTLPSARPREDAAAEPTADRVRRAVQPTKLRQRAVQPVDASRAERTDLATARAERAKRRDAVRGRRSRHAAAGSRATERSEPARATDMAESDGDGAEDEDEIVESVGGADALEEVPERAPRSRRQYKIQEVIKRRQVMLVQVVKEERGNKGAALTTYLSLAGRYSVLMPNTARGGGISRKITSARRPQAPQGDRAGARSAGGHGRHPAHRRRRAHQDRDQARLRISAAAVGDGARPDAAIDGADARLRGRLADQALDPRPLQQGHRRDRRRRRRTPTAKPRTSCACSCRAMPRT